MRPPSVLVGEPRHYSVAPELTEETRDRRDAPDATAKVGHVDSTGRQILRRNRLPRDGLETGDGNPYTHGIVQIIRLCKAA